MKAIVLKGSGGVDQLEYTEVEKPYVGKGEVLIKIKAVSINPIDVKTRSGKGAYEKLKHNEPIILGWDVSGIVEETNSELLDIGKEVFGMINFPGHGKAYAEYATAPAHHLTEKPEEVSYEEAAVSTLAALTAWQALVKYVDVKAGDNVLIHAASGGVGHFAVQFAKHFGATVVGTSSLKNRDFVLGLGADEHIDYQDYDWKSSSYRFDFVLDTIGGKNIDDSLEVMKKGATLVSLPSGLNGDVAEKAEAKGVKGYAMMVKSDGEDMALIAGLLKSGAVKPHISDVFNFEQMREAHLQQETGRTVGKIAVKVSY